MLEVVVRLVVEEAEDAVTRCDCGFSGRCLGRGVRMNNQEFCDQICDAIRDALGSDEYSCGSVSDAIRHCLRGLNNDDITLADAVENLSDSQKKIAHAITAGCAEGTDATGGVVLSLTEAVMGVTAGLCRIADSIQSLADAIESKGK